MFRLLATMLLLAGLTLGQSGYESFADSGLAAGGSDLTVMHEAAARDQGEGHKGVPENVCHSLSCPQTFLAKAGVPPVRAAACSDSGPVINERNARSINLEREPPIPRSPI